MVSLNVLCNCGFVFMTMHFLCMQAMPITAAYLPIVYSDIIYAPYLPLLTRMLFLANACIQWAVAGMSSMHFAIGQVQVRT